MPRLGKFTCSSAYNFHMNSNPPLRLVTLGFVAGRFDLDLLTLQGWLERHCESPLLIVNGMALYDAATVERAVSAILWPDLGSEPLVHSDPGGSVEFEDEPLDDDNDDGDEPDEPDNPAPIMRGGLDISELLRARNHE